MLRCSPFLLLILQTLPPGDGLLGNLAWFKGGNKRRNAFKSYQQLLSTCKVQGRVLGTKNTEIMTNPYVKVFPT